MTEHASAKCGEYPRDQQPPFDFAPIFVFEHYLFLKAQSFRRAWNTARSLEQIMSADKYVSEHILDCFIRAKWRLLYIYHYQGPCCYSFELKYLLFSIYVLHRLKEKQSPCSLSAFSPNKVFPFNYQRGKFLALES